MAFGRLQTIRNLYRKVEIRDFSYLLGSSRSYSHVSVNVPKTSCWSISSHLYKGPNALLWISRDTMTLHSTMGAELFVSLSKMRLVSTQAKAPPQARHMVCNISLKMNLITLSPNKPTRTTGLVGNVSYVFAMPSAFRRKASTGYLNCPRRSELFRSNNSAPKGAFKVSMLSPGIIYEPYAPREQISFWKRWFTRRGWKRTKEDIILELKSAYAIAKLRKSGYSKHKFYEEAIDLYKEVYFYELEC
ncbi:unnamed protein product [Ilex paraguariensis]|uniref:Uncharacterized protein n=1 Tax=Ilex paraguariensis TaxID=185542 RepID=A0ABC8QT74_9AQUA